tara:strand:- start:306 stop:1124 length:819 start_codon:yes stop_codon:yes gene_type:complete
MRSSCAPYKDCLTIRKNRKKIKGGKTKKNKRTQKTTYKKNILGTNINICSTNPMTGFYRDGYCMTGEDDKGTHTVCAKMNKRFLEYTKSKGNDLSSVVKPGQQWCLCEYRWQEALKDGKAPIVDMKATNMRTTSTIRKQIKKFSKINKKNAYFAGGGKSKKKTKKQFLFNPDDPKKSFDVYIDKDPTDTIHIKYKTLKDVKDTIQKLENLYKQGKYPHKRIWQVGMILYVRLKVLKNKKKEHYSLAKRYFTFLGKRTKIKDEKDRKKYKFKI